VPVVESVKRHKVVRKIDLKSSCRQGLLKSMGFSAVLALKLAIVYAEVPDENQ